MKTNRSIALAGIALTLVVTGYNTPSGTAAPSPSMIEARTRAEASQQRLADQFWADKARRRKEANNEMAAENRREVTRLRKRTVQAGPDAEVPERLFR